MSVRERTRQQLDPAGTLGARTTTVVLAGGALVYAAVQTLLSREQLASPSLAIAALLALAGASWTVIGASGASRPIFSRQVLVITICFAMTAAVFSVAAGWTQNSLIRDDWPSISIGLLFAAMSPYRPATELAGFGVLCAIFLGFLVLLETPYFVSEDPVVAYVVVDMTPMLAFVFGSAAFASGIVRSIERWQRRATRATSTIADQLRDGIARSVQQDRVTILGRDVLPFFSDVLGRDEVTDADRDRARSIAESIRSVMVAEVDRSWLESVIEQTIEANDLSRGSGVVVQDAERLAQLMSTDQRTALRALIVALFEVAEFDRSRLAISLRRHRSESRGIIRARLDMTEHGMRAALAPYFAVMRVVFSTVQIDFVQPTLTIKFSYEQR